MAKELHRAPESLSVWESNMKELRKRQPVLGRLLDAYVEKQGHEFAHFETTTPAGTWIEGLTPKPFFQPHAEPKFEWHKRDKDKPSFILFGIGAPPYLFKAIRSLPKEAMSLLVVEHNMPLLAYVLHLTHVYQAARGACKLTFWTKTDEIPDLALEKGDSDASAQLLELDRLNGTLREEALNVALEPLGIYAVSLSKVSIHPGQGETFKEQFLLTSKELSEWINVRLQFLGNSAEDTMLGVRQIALMSPWVAFGKKLGHIRGKFENRPFVCVAAGPSLDKNFELLRDIQNKCVIVAADAVLKKLLSNGIRPHIVTALERGVLTYELFFAENVETYREECEKILLVAQSLCTPRIAGRWPGPVCTVGKHELPVDKWLVGDILSGQTMSSGTSVAHMNYSIAATFGASAIAIIGQDLAYGETGHSHAGGISGNWTVDKPVANFSQTIEIPGALGGLVKTSPVWLSFLKVLESFIKSSDKDTYDCTEGGAKIAGATVLPFADFIEERVLPLDAISQTPAEIIEGSGGEINKGEIAKRAEARVEAEIKNLDEVLELLDSVEETMEKTVAPGLEPARRIMHAMHAGSLLDDIHHKHGVLAFIGQSYTHAAAIELSITRSLDTVDEIERWLRLHKDIVDAHRGALFFLEKWLRYVQIATRHYAMEEKSLTPLEADEAGEWVMRLLRRSTDAAENEIADIRLDLDAIMVRSDPLRLGWGGHILWNLALILEQAGRNEEAVSYMQKSAADFEGKELPVSDMVTFFKDYARILCGYDLCHAPQYDLAEIMLTNAVELNGGIDDECRQLLERIMDGEVAAYEDLRIFGQGAGAANWFRERAVGQRALFDGDLNKALLAVWKAIQAHYKDVPGWAASHLDWLAQTLEKCMPVSDAILRATVERIVDELAASTNLLKAIPITFRKEFIEELARRGLKVSLHLKPDVSANSECESESAEVEAEREAVTSVSAE